MLLYLLNGVFTPFYWIPYGVVSCFTLLPLFITQYSDKNGFESDNKKKKMHIIIFLIIIQIAKAFNKPLGMTGLFERINNQLIYKIEISPDFDKVVSSDVIGITYETEFNKMLSKELLLTAINSGTKIEIHKLNPFISFVQNNYIELAITLFIIYYISKDYPKK
jgi:hypothetical protein